MVVFNEIYFFRLPAKLADAKEAVKSNAIRQNFIFESIKYQK